MLYVLIHKIRHLRPSRFAFTPPEKKVFTIRELYMQIIYPYKSTENSLAFQAFPQKQLLQIIKYRTVLSPHKSRTPFHFLAPINIQGNFDVLFGPLVHANFCKQFYGWRSAAVLLQTTPILMHWVHPLEINGSTVKCTCVPSSSRANIEVEQLNSMRAHREFDKDVDSNFVNKLPIGNPSKYSGRAISAFDWRVRFFLKFIRISGRFLQKINVRAPSILPLKYES